MSVMSVNIVLGCMSLPASEVWDLLRSTHPAFLGGAGRCEVSGQKCALNEVAAQVASARSGHFWVVVDGMEFHYGHIRNFDHSLVWGRRCVRDAADAWRWVEPFTSAASFRQAWVYSEEYVHWQNAQDPLECSAEGRSVAGLPMVSNGLPPPLEQAVVDVSGNPGRRLMRGGYVESVAHLMWLGETFWALTGVSKDQVCRSRLVHCEQVSRGVVRLQCAPQPFLTAEGNEGALQRELRALIYPTSRQVS